MQSLCFSSVFHRYFWELYLRTASTILLHIACRPRSIGEAVPVLSISHSVSPFFSHTYPFCIYAHCILMPIKSLSLPTEA